MATFTGTRSEFRRYIGPRLRNLVQQLTKKHKAEISACQHCGSAEHLESAHVFGRDRNDIIEFVLNKTNSQDVVFLDILQFERCFIEEHQPLEKAIIILCRSCHKKYDAKAPLTINAAERPMLKLKGAALNYELLPISLNPPDPEMFKRALLIAKQAVIEIYFSDGSVEHKHWNAANFTASSNVIGNLRSRSEFRASKWQDKGIVKVQVTVDENSGQEPQS